jgi:hypothetical protein
VIPYALQATETRILDGKRSDILIGTGIDFPTGQKYIHTCL